MRSLFLDPGRFRTELVLQASTQVSDGQGGFADAWSEVGSVMALLEPVDARGVFAADQAANLVSHRITIRARAGVASGMRFAKGERRFEIVAVHDADETGRYLVCRTREIGR